MSRVQRFEGAGQGGSLSQGGSLNPLCPWRLALVNVLHTREWWGKAPRTATACEAMCLW